MRFNVSIPSIIKWKRRDAVEDSSHTAHCLQTTLTPVQECIAVELCKLLKLSLNDLLVEGLEFLNPAVSRAGLDCCLRRHGMNCLRDLAPAAPTKCPAKPFKAYGPGDFHLGVKYLPQMPDESARRYLFIASTVPSVGYLCRSKRTRLPPARAFLVAVQKAAPCHMRTTLTDNGSEFTDRLFNRQKQPSGEHEFDYLCAALGVEYRLAKPRGPQTNDMVERFNGRIREVLATHHFASG